MLLFLYLKLFLFFQFLTKCNVDAQTTQQISTTGTLQAAQFECPDNCTCLRREFERENKENCPKMVWDVKLARNWKISRLRTWT